MSVARQYKLREYGVNPIIPENTKNFASTNFDTGRGKSMIRTSDFT